MQPKIIEYLIASDISPNGLQKAVKDYLSKGWQPQGGIAIGIDKNNRLYYQAMVRYE
jgi:hypothetical protein